MYRMLSFALLMGGLFVHAGDVTVVNNSGNKLYGIGSGKGPHSPSVESYISPNETKIFTFSAKFADGKPVEFQFDDAARRHTAINKFTVNVGQTITIGVDNQVSVQ